MVARGRGDVTKNFSLAIPDRPARQYRDPAIYIAPCRHAGGPVAALDDAGIEVDRMGHRLEVPVAPGALVPFGLELLQTVNEMVGGRDRIGTGAGLEHMHGMAAYFEAKPDNPHLRADHPAGGRFGNETGVGPVASLQ